MERSKEMINEKQVIIWGTGLNAVQFTYQVEDILEIVGYIDSNGDYGQFNGKPVCRLAEILDVRRYYIFFAGAISAYENEIRPQLLQLGLKEFENFMYAGWYHKKMALLHGNCHMHALSEALSSSEEFSKEYFIYKHRMIQEYKDGETINSYLIEHCDVFIHEDIQPQNRYGYKLSDEYLVPLLKESCKNITIPNLFGLGKGFFPQYNGYNPIEKNRPLNNGEDRNGMFPHSDTIIDQAIMEGIKWTEIVEYSKRNVFSEEEILRNFNLYMDKIRDRENDWDIKVSSFINERYQEEKLFYDIGHPTEAVIIFIATEIFALLGLETDDKIACNPMDAHETPVYPCVKDALGLKWDTQYIRKQGKKIVKNMDLAEYIREYVAWCYPDYLSGL